MSTTTLPHGGVLHRARLYDLETVIFGRRVRALHRRLIERAAIAPGERVLDVGCGPGRLTLAAARAAGPTGEALGIDPSPEMIALASKNAARAAIPARFEIAGIEVLKPRGRFVALDFRATPGHGIAHLLNVLGLRRGSEHAEHLRSLAVAARFTDVGVEPTTPRAFCVLHARKP